MLIAGSINGSRNRARAICVRLLLESEIAQTMDTLITRAQNGTSDGLRALGVTAQLDIERFRRMAIVAPGAMSREDGHFDRSPPLESYLQALELFAETFRPAGGLRLLRIARPRCCSTACTTRTSWNTTTRCST